MRLQANKGWTAERRYDVLREFLRREALYGKALAFARKLR